MYILKLPLTVALITFNEEENLPRTLERVVDIASEIVILDSYSTDRTKDIALSYGAKFYQERWKGFREQKNSLLNKCSQQWILFLDADEVLSEELKISITNELRNPRAEGYFINRKTFYIGKFLNFSWQPDWKLRLVNRNSNPRWEGGNIHEYLAIDGKVDKLKGYLYHYTYKDIEDHFQRALKYSKISAVEMHKRGKRFKLYKLLLNPIWAFSKQYFFHLGFLDGIRGLSVAMSYLISTFLKYLYLWELEEQERKNEKG